MEKEQSDYVEHGVPLAEGVQSESASKNREENEKSGVL